MKRELIALVSNQHGKFAKLFRCERTLQSSPYEYYEIEILYQEQIKIQGVSKQDEIRYFDGFETWIKIKDKPIYIKQSKNSFIRTTERYGYITNQLPRHARSYDSFGAALSREISRNPQQVVNFVTRLLTI